MKRPASRALGRQTAQGGMLMVGARLITRIIDLMTMLVLARLLGPADFGLVAIAVSAVSFFEALLEMPLNQALLRLPVITRGHYDTAFTLGVMRGLVLSLSLLLISWPFSWFYADQRLIGLICALTLGPIARGLVSPRLAEYQQNMSFWRDFAVELGGKITAFAVGVGIALYTQSYWAITAGAVTYAVAMAAVSYCLAPYRPRLSLAEISIFSGFVGWMTAAQLVSALNWQFERLLLGKLKTASELGLFATASDIAAIPFLALFGPVSRPLLAAFSQLKADQALLSRGYQTVSCAIVTIGLPLLVGESLVAEPSVTLILGEKWLAAVPLVRWLALSLAPGLLALAAAPLVMSFGDTKLFLKRNLVEACVKFPIALIGTIEFGFPGIVAARLLSELAAGFYAMSVVRRLTGLSIKDQLLGSWRGVASTLVMVPPVMMCLDQLHASIGQSGGTASQAAAELLITGLVGAVVYCTTLVGLWHFSGRPPGIEAMGIDGLSTFIGRALRRA